jgi:hypothetical protein
MRNLDGHSFDVLGSVLGSSAEQRERWRGDVRASRRLIGDVQASRRLIGKV